MALPGVSETVRDGGLGLLGDTSEPHAGIGPAAGGTVAAVYEFTDPDTAKTTLVGGPLLEYVAFLLTTGAARVLAVRSAASVSGSDSAVVVTRVGTSTGTLAVTGTPVDAYEAIARVTRAGTRGTAAYQLALDGGDTFDAETLVPANGVVTPPGTGLTLTFDTGTLDVGDQFAFTTVPSGSTTSDLVAAFTALRNDPRQVGSIGVVGAPAPAATAVTSVGTAPPVVALTGTPTDYVDLRLEITTGGARGTAVFRYSFDGGATWAATGVLTAATVALTGSGLTAAFATGTNYSTDNVYTADTLAGLPALAAFVETQASTSEAAGRYHFVIIEAPRENPNISDTKLLAVMASFAGVRTGVAAGTAELVSGVSGRIYRRSSAWVAAQRIVTTPVQEHPSRVLSGPVAGVASLHRDEQITPGLDAGRFVTLRTIPERAGFWVTRGRLMAPQGSDFAQWMNRRVLDKAASLARAKAWDYVAEDLQLNADGTLDAVVAITAEKDLAGAVRAGMNTGPRTAISGVAVQVPRDTDIAQTATFLFKLSVQPKGYAEYVTITIGLAATLPSGS